MSKTTDPVRDAESPTRRVPALVYRALDKAFQGSCLLGWPPSTVTSVCTVKPSSQAETLHCETIKGYKQGRHLKCSDIFTTRVPFLGLSLGQRHRGTAAGSKVVALGTSIKTSVKNHCTTPEPLSIQVSPVTLPVSSLLVTLSATSSASGVRGASPVALDMTSLDCFDVQ